MNKYQEKLRDELANDYIGECGTGAPTMEMFIDGYNAAMVQAKGLEDAIEKCRDRNRHGGDLEFIAYELGNALRKFRGKDE